MCHRGFFSYLLFSRFATCELVPLVSFDFSSPQPARFFKFVVDSFVGSGGALKYIKLE